VTFIKENFINFVVNIYSMDRKYQNLDERLQQNQKMSVGEAASILLEYFKKYVDQHGGIRFRYIYNNNRGDTNGGFGIESGDGRLMIIYDPNKHSLNIKIGTTEFRAGNELYIDIRPLLKILDFIIDNYKKKGL